MQLAEPVPTVDGATQSTTSPRTAVFLNRFYWPDVTATAQMLADLAEDLARDGWTVTVVTSRTDYAGQSAELARREHHNGVDIVRIASTRLGRQRMLGRIVDYLSYLIGAAWVLLRLPRQDMVVAMSDPPFVSAVAVALGKLRRWQVVYWVQDVYPELAARLGVLSERSAVYRICARLARAIHQRCDVVVALGPRMADALAQAGASRRRIVVAHNWADSAALTPIAQGENAFLATHDLHGRFVVLYSGNLGRAHTFHAVQECMARLRAREDIVFVFIGGGARLPAVKAFAAEARLPNVRFVDYVPREHLASSLSAADVSLVTESPSAVGLLVPSKTYGILASGRPIIFVGSNESDVAAIVRGTNAGVVVAPEDADLLVATIERLASDRATRLAMGVRGRAASMSTYDRRVATKWWADTVTQALNS